MSVLANFAENVPKVQAQLEIQAAIRQLIGMEGDGGWRDIYRGGWRPSWFNQQWGGAQFGEALVDTATGILHRFDVATGSIDENVGVGIADGAIITTRSQGFRVSESGNYSAVWLKAYKGGNPTTSLQVSIVADDGTGTKPLNVNPIANGVANALPAKVVASDVYGEWYRLTFPVPVALVAGTQYHLLFKSSGVVDAANFIGLRAHSNSKYPLGRLCNGDGANVFTVVGLWSACFMFENIKPFYQRNGRFGEKLVFAEGSPINQSKSLVQPMRNFFDGEQFTCLMRVSSAQKGKPIADFSLGLDHDRLVISTDANGSAVVNFYDASRNLVTLNSATDISGIALSDVAVSARLKGDGADYLKLLINGVVKAETSNRTYNVSKLWREQGTAWIGGGFPLSPVWTGDLQMNSLPSLQGWTFGGGIEANAFSVQNGRLFQNRTGMASGDAPAYTKGAIGFNNATGWAVEFSVRAANNTNTYNSGNINACGGVHFVVSDGAKYLSVAINEYYLAVGGSTVDFTLQGPFVNAEHVFLLCGKGSDYYLFIDGMLAIDGTGKLTVATAANQITFGDCDTNANENADATWASVKHYTGGMMLPQASTGLELHELAYWSGDKTSHLAALYNGDAPVSVARLAGMKNSYVDVATFTESRRMVSGQAQTTATSGNITLLPEMECFCLGSMIEMEHEARASVPGTSAAYFSHTYIDGREQTTTEVFTGAASVMTTSLSHDTTRDVNLGLHKAEVRFWSGNAATVVNYYRELTVRSKA